MSKDVDMVKATMRELANGMGDLARRAALNDSQSASSLAPPPHRRDGAIVRESPLNEASMPPLDFGCSPVRTQGVSAPAPAPARHSSGYAPAKLPMRFGMGASAFGKAAKFLGVTSSSAGAGVLASAVARRVPPAVGGLRNTCVPAQLLFKKMGRDSVLPQEKSTLLLLVPASGDLRDAFAVQGLVPLFKADNVKKTGLSREVLVGDCTGEEDFAKGVQHMARNVLLSGAYPALPAAKGAFVEMLTPPVEGEACQDEGCTTVITAPLAAISGFTVLSTRVNPKLLGNYLYALPGLRGSMDSSNAPVHAHEAHPEPGVDEETGEAAVRTMADSVVINPHVYITSCCAKTAAAELQLRCVRQQEGGVAANYRGFNPFSLGARPELEVVKIPVLQGAETSDLMDVRDGRDCHVPVLFGVHRDSAWLTALVQGHQSQHWLDSYGKGEYILFLMRGLHDSSQNTHQCKVLRPVDMGDGELDSNEGDEEEEEAEHEEYMDAGAGAGAGNKRSRY